MTDERVQRQIDQLLDQAEEAMVDAAQGRLDRNDRLLWDLDKQINRSDNLRPSVLRSAFSGRLVPQDSNNEPAEELLKRIKAEKAASLKISKKRSATRA